MRAVGGADLDQPRAGARHDVRHAERAADLDQLAARHDRLAAARQRVEHEQHRGGIVVDDGRVLGAGQFAQQAAQVVVALAALAVREIEFERDRVAHRRDRRLDRLLGDQRAAEIGVQHGAGEIEHRPQARLARSRRAAPARRRLPRRSTARCGRARRAERRAHRIDHGAAAEAVDRVEPRASASPRRPREACAAIPYPLHSSADARQRISGVQRLIAMRPRSNDRVHDHDGIVTPSPEGTTTPARG